MELKTRQLFIKQKVFKITDHYPVIDIDGNEVYCVDEEFKFIGRKIQVYREDKSQSFTIEKEIFRFLNHFKVTFYDGRQIMMNQKFNFMGKASVEVKSEDCDISLIGNFFNYNFDIFNGEEKIGNINKRLLTWGDTFIITVYNEDYEEIILALLLMADYIVDTRD